MRSTTRPLTPPQLEVLALLSAGSTVAAAAEKVGIHRNTIANWRRSSPAFRQECQAISYEQSLHWRDELQAIAHHAVDTIRMTMVNGHVPWSARLRAALSVLERVTTLPPDPPPAPKGPSLVVLPAPNTSADSGHPDPNTREGIPGPVEAAEPPAAQKKVVEIHTPETHPAQPAHTPDPTAPALPLGKISPAAQSCTTTRPRRLAPAASTPSRNALCPCGSGRKFKRC